MKRRKFLLGAGAAAGGTASLLGTGAFASVTAQRQIEISIVDDSDAYLRLAPCKAGNNGAYVDDVSSTAIAIDLTASNPNDPPAGSGVTSEARTKFYNVFEVCNQGTQDVCVDFRLGAEGVDDVPTIPGPVPSVFDFSAGDDAVVFYKGADESARITGLDTLDTDSSEAFHLAVGECQCVGFNVRAFGFNTPETLFSDVDLFIRADANANCASSGGGGGGPTAPTNGLVGHWPLDSIGDGTAEDIVGTNDGTAMPQSNGPVATTRSTDDGSDDAASFDGDDDYIELTDSSSDPFALTNFSVAAWARANNSTGDLQTVIVRQPGGGSNLFEERTFVIWFDDDGFFGVGDLASRIAETDSNIPTITADDEGYLDDRWYHLVLTVEFDSGAGSGIMKFYVDGNSKGTTSLNDPPDTGSAETWIGAQPNDSRYLNGAVDDVRIYDRALSDSEVQNLYGVTK